MVEVKGFEPPVPCSQSRCDNQTSLHLDKILNCQKFALVALLRCPKLFTAWCAKSFDRSASFCSLYRPPNALATSPKAGAITKLRYTSKLICFCKNHYIAKVLFCQQKEIKNYKKTNMTGSRFYPRAFVIYKTNISYKLSLVYRTEKLHLFLNGSFNSSSTVCQKLSGVEALAL